MTEPTRDANPDEAETLFELVSQRYGNRLSAAQLAEVRKVVDGIVQAARALRSVKLQSSDEPFQPFVPYRADT
jgi:hypothetical protein